MTLKQISYFQAVCEKGNISSAAEDLFVARSVISRAIADLEDEFGAELFVRSKNGVVLTDSGRIVAKLFPASQLAITPPAPGSTSSIRGPSRALSALESLPPTLTAYIAPIWMDFSICILRSRSV